MVLLETKVSIVDNSNITIGRCIHIFGGFQNKYATVGDFILISVQNKINIQSSRVKMYLAVVISVNKNKRRLSGNFIKFDNNCVLLFSDKENLLGTEVLGPIDSTLRNHKLLQLPLLSHHFI